MAHPETRAAESSADVATADSGAKDENRLAALRTRVRRLPGGFLVWRIGVTVVGVAIIVGGVVLLPLPGPGWVIIFAGLGVLATEYEWAKRLLRYARDQVKRWTGWIKEQPRWLQAVVVVAGLVFLAAVFYLVYLVLYS